MGEHEADYCAAVGVDDTGAIILDAADVATFSHLFSIRATLFFVKTGMEACNWAGPADRKKLIEAMEAMSVLPYGIERRHGTKMFNGKTHKVFSTQRINQARGGKLIRVN